MYVRRQVRFMLREKFTWSESICPQMRKILPIKDGKHFACSRCLGEFVQNTRRWVRGTIQTIPNSISVFVWCFLFLISGSSVNEENTPFMPKPFCMYSGHTSDLLDVSWSKNYFVLSSSMDKTVRLWHISRKECLCCFQHIDFVTAICFHPKDDR